MLRLNTLVCVTSSQLEHMLPWGEGGAEAINTPESPTAPYILQLKLWELNWSWLLEADEATLLFLFFNVFSACSLGVEAGKWFKATVCSGTGHHDRPRGTALP